MSVSEPLIQASLLGEAVENGPAVVLVADEDGRHVAVNRAACELLGYSREELLALPVTEVARYPGAAADYDEFTRGGARSGTVELTRKDGSTVELDYVAGATLVAGLTVFVCVGVAAS